MKIWHMLWWTLSLFAVLTCFKPDPASAYIVSPPTTLGSMVKVSTQVIVVKVEKVDRDKNVIVWRKVREIKGKWPSDLVTHRLGVETKDKKIVEARDRIMKWAEEGKTTIIFAHSHNNWAHTYIDQQWYCGTSPDWKWWNMSHGEPVLLKVYSGKADELVAAIEAIAAGKEVVVPCLAEGKAQRMKASLKLLDYNLKRDLVE